MREQPVLMIEHHHRSVLQIDFGNIPVEALALGHIGDAACLGQQRIELLVAVFAPIQKPVTGQPDRHIAVRVRPPGPDADIGVKVATLRRGHRRIGFHGLDLHLKPGFPGHGLDQLGGLLRGGRIAHHQLHRHFAQPERFQHRPRRAQVPLRHRVGGIPIRAARGLGLVGWHLRAFKRHLVDQAPVDRKFKRLAHPGLGGEFAAPEHPIAQIEQHGLVGDGRCH